LPVICGPRTKAGAIAAHGLRNTRTGRQGQAGRQARRAAAGFNKWVEPTADGAVSLSLRRRVSWSHGSAVAHPDRSASFAHMRYITFIIALSSVLFVGCTTEQARIRRGEYLLSAADAQPGSTYELGVYVVAKGDTVFSMCKRFQIPIREFEAINPGLEVTHLLVGQKVRIYERIKQ